MVKIALFEGDRAMAEPLLEYFKERPGFKPVLYSISKNSLPYDELKQFAPDVVLIDLADEDRWLLDNIPDVKAIFPGMRVIAHSSRLGPNLLLEALRCGADSYYVPGNAPQELVKAVELTLSGGSYLDAYSVSVLIDYFRDASKKTFLSQNTLQDWQKSGRFVAREVQVIDGLMNNLSYKEIATRNNVGLNTVRHYVKSVYKKLKINSRTQLKEILSTTEK